MIRRRAGGASRAAVLAFQGFWEVAGFGANVLLFVVVGMQLDALALPADHLPHRGELVAIVFGVTFITLSTQALPFRRVLHLLGVALAPDDAFDTARANLIAARRGQAELDSLLARSCVIAGIALDGAVQAPRGATVIEAGAELLVISARADLTSAIAMFLESAPAADPGRPPSPAR